MPKYAIKIYVAKDKISMNAVKELNDALKGTDFRLKIVDVQKFPEEAEKKQHHCHANNNQRASAAV